MSNRQIYCTVNEIHEGSELRGSEKEFRVFEKLMAASQLVAMRIGSFLPVSEVRKVTAEDETRKLFLRFPLLRVSAVTNYTTVLTSDDYLLMPDGRHWVNGPYSALEVALYATNLSEWDDTPNGIVITCTTGLYDATADTGATVGSALNDSGTTLQVSNGAKVSAGAVLLIESEWLFVMETSTPVSAVTTLSASLDAVAEVCTVADGSLLNVGEIIRMGVEQAKVVDINGNTVALQRGWNKTTKSSHASSSNVDVYRKFTVERAVNGSTAAAHSQGVTISRQVVPADVNELTRKIAVRMLKDASANYAGQVGSDATGSAMYMYILPHELDEILERYCVPVIG